MIEMPRSGISEHGPSLVIRMHVRQRKTPVHPTRSNPVVRRSVVLPGITHMFRAHFGNVVDGVHDEAVLVKRHNARSRRRYVAVSPQRVFFVSVIVPCLPMRSSTQVECRMVPNIMLWHVSSMALLSKVEEWCTIL